MIPVPVWRYYSDSSNTGEVSLLRNSLLPSYIMDAVVELTLTDAVSGEELAGENWPIVVPVVALSNGVYRITVSSGIVVTVGQRLVRTYVVEIGATKRTWRHPGIVV